MSKYIDCEMNIQNQDALIAALHEMGYKTIEVGHNISLYGYHGDRRAETADVVIRRKYVRVAANDIGFRKQEDGTFKAIVSQYDLGQDPHFVEKVVELASIHNTMLTAQKEGWTCKRIQNKDGETELLLERWT